MTVPSSSAYAKVNGLEMYYEVHGAGPEEAARWCCCTGVPKPSV